MANVVLREGYLESRRIALLANDPMAERFYFHLLLVVDEKGRFEANHVLLRNRCFPALENVCAAEVAEWLETCVKADLIRTFDEDGKRMLEVLRNEPPQRQKKERADSTAASDDSNSIFPFLEFWEMYGKKVELQKCRLRYSKLDETDRRMIRERLPEYIAATPDVTYRKHPSTWLNNRCWEDLSVKQVRRKGF